MSWTFWIGHAVVLASFALMMICALTFKRWHRRRSRRAPLEGRKVGHLPGRQLLERIQHHHDKLADGIALMFMAMPLMFMVWATFRLQWEELRWGLIEWMFVAGALGMFGWGLYDYVRHYRRREQASDGWTAEQVTGMQLNRLMAMDCRVLHDLPADGFNIDHVVVAPRGVYAVETKSFRKPKSASDARRGPAHEVTYDGKHLSFPGFRTAAPMAQAARQAQWLRRYLREAIEEDVPVIPAVSLPGWFVKKTLDGKRAETVVFTPMGRAAEFLAGEPERLDPMLPRRIAQVLAGRYPILGESS